MRTSKTICLVLIFVFNFTSSSFAVAEDGIDCGQHQSAPYTFNISDTPTIKTPLTIDYAVFYTPEARATEGDTSAMLARIEAAFVGANERFSLSGSPITHRVVHTQELPLNNTSQTLPELNTELATAFDFFSILDAKKADTAVIVVNFQIPGGFAIIPQTKGNALRGGTINLGLPNLSGSILAHEIGHTLGMGHDYVESSQITPNFFDLPPTYNYGNHFIGSTTGICYRTIMSARTTCRIAGYESVATVLSDRFSSPTLLFDGTPTGDAVNADAVRMFSEFGPFLASARGDSQFPDTPPGEDPEMPDEEESDTLTLSIRKNKKTQKFAASGRCFSSENTALTGDSIQIYRIMNKQGWRTLVKTVSCNAKGKFAATIQRAGRYRARNTRTETESSIVRISS